MAVSECPILGCRVGGSVFNWVGATVGMKATVGMTVRHCKCCTEISTMHDVYHKQSTCIRMMNGGPCRCFKSPSQQGGWANSTGQTTAS